MPRYKITIEYKGTNLLGWQKQIAGPSVQEHISKAIYNFCQEEVEVTAAGRTDAGVHAYAQIAHFDLQKEKELYVIQNALNFYLNPHDIAIINAESVDDDFHARFSAKKRKYVYKILNRKSPSVLEKDRMWHLIHPLNLDLMNEAAQHLIGEHDFSSFRASDCQAKSALRSIDKIIITKEDDVITLFIEAQSFLHHMVRNIVGTLRDVGVGKISPADFKSILNAKDRTIAGITAPAHGLYFLGVDY